MASRPQIEKVAELIKQGYVTVEPDSDAIGSPIKLQSPGGIYVLVTAAGTVKPLPSSENPK
jgi:hypothetical protein